MGVDSVGERRSIPISALEHHAYCPRQAALIHIDSYFDASIDTVRGDLAHAAVDRGGVVSGTGRRRLARSLPVWSDRLGLHGVCDVVEFTPTAIVPIEHKSGGYRPGGAADLQVAAQVLCLREMLITDNRAEVPIGVVFSGQDRRRHEVIVDADLADWVESTTATVRELFDAGALPPGVNDYRCRRCSLKPGCLPEVPAITTDLFTPRPLGDWHD